MIIESITQIIIYTIYLLILDYKVAFVIILSSGLCLFLPNITGKNLSNRRKYYLDKIGQYMNKISDLLCGFSNINRLTRKNFKLEEYKILEKMENSRLNYGKFKAFTIVLNGFFMYLLDIMAFSAVVISLLFQRITIGTASALLSYIKEFTFPIRSLISSISSMKSTKAVKTKIFSILSYTEPELISISKFEKFISFENVTVAWEHFHLERFTYCFKKGKKYAIIGHSGSGKSTLFHLLMQEEYPKSGSIKIDNRDIITLEYSSIISYISQKEYIFKENFENNVTLFHSYLKRNMEEAIFFIKNEKLQNLMQKEDCSTLSGGEKNLLSTVKMLIIDKEIILLDEIFSALDFNTKILLQKSIYENLSKTMIVITHDITLENLQYFDEILIMKDGKLICSGLKEKAVNSKEYRNLLQN